MVAVWRQRFVGALGYRLRRFGDSVSCCCWRVCVCVLQVCLFSRAPTQQWTRAPRLLAARCSKMSDGLFLECTREVARGYPNIEYLEMIVDNACMQVRACMVFVADGVALRVADVS